MTSKQESITQKRGLVILLPQYIINSFPNKDNGNKLKRQAVEGEKITCKTFSGTINQ